MLIELGYFIFLLPGDWHDTSSYIYKSTEQNVALTISFGKTRDAITLEDFVTQRRQELSDTMKDTIEFQSQQQSTIGPLPAITQSFRFSVQSKNYQEYWSTAYYEENKYLRLSYVGPVKDKTLKPTFDHMLTSIQLSPHPQPKTISASYIWRQANILSLLIPKNLQPPKHQTYASQNGSLTLKVSLYTPNDKRPDNNIESYAEKDLRFGGSLGASSTEYQHNLVIQQIDYVFQGGDPLEPQRYRAHRAQITGFGEQLFLFVKGHESQASQIDAFWAKFVKDLIENSRANSSGHKYNMN